MNQDDAGPIQGILDILEQLSINVQNMSDLMVLMDVRIHKLEGRPVPPPLAKLHSEAALRVIQLGLGSG